MTEAPSEKLEFETNGIAIARNHIQASMKDGEVLHGFHYSRTSSLGRGKNALAPLETPLLCFASELGNAKEYHDFILEFLSLPGASKSLYALDLRGRGASLKAHVDGTTISTDADDIISFCDTLNLHHADILVSGRSSAPVLLTTPKRPSLIRKLVLNDAAPEYDSVGIARQTARKQRQSMPTSWEQAATALAELKKDEFPELGDSEWRELAKTVWNDDDGKPAPAFSKDLVRFSNAVSYDDKQQMFWREFAVLKDRPTLLLRGELSSFVTKELAAKMEATHEKFAVQEVPLQGHCPILKMKNLSADILTFLRS